MHQMFIINFSFFQFFQIELYYHNKNEDYCRVHKVMRPFLKYSALDYWTKLICDSKSQLKAQIQPHKNLDYEPNIIPGVLGSARMPFTHQDYFIHSQTFKKRTEGRDLKLYACWINKHGGTGITFFTNI